MYVVPKRSSQFAMVTQKIFIGYRFVLTRDVDRFPHFIAKRGMTGIVKEMNPDGAIITSIDQPLRGSEEWDNELWWLDGELAFLEDTGPLKD